jgi:hypothetical protein
VCDPAGELPDRLHLVGEPQLLLEPGAFGDVAADRLGSDRSSVLEQETARYLDPYAASVLRGQVVLVDGGVVGACEFRLTRLIQ